MRERQPLDEVWLPVPGYPDYQVSDRGRIRRATDSKRQWQKGFLLKQKLTRHGYLEVKLSNWQGFRYFKVHRLVCLAFYGKPKPEQTQVRHLDGNPENNSLSNLRWGTPKENAADRARHGKWNYEQGERHHNARLNFDAVCRMRRLRRSGFTIVKIAESFQVPKVTAREAIIGVTWRDADEPPVRKERRRAVA